MVCIRYHGPTNANLDKYDSSKLGHHVVTDHSRQRLSSLYEVTYLTYFLSQDSHTYGGQMVWNRSHYVIITGMEGILGHQVQIRRAIDNDPIVSILNLSYDLRQEGSFSKILPCVLSKSLC